jgi:glutamine cyclotransferase
LNTVITLYIRLWQPIRLGPLASFSKWRTRRVAALLDMKKAIGDPRDMNGIAYMKSQGRLFVTGKFWKHVYEVRVTAP